MRIGGFQKTSLIDWEGKIASMIFTKGCNFRCGYCHNPSLVLPELMNRTPDIQEELVLSYLRNRINWLDGVVISGGEPTIHKDLPEFLHKIRQIGLPVKLDTNGTNSQMIKKLIDNKLIDYISMDIKTIIRAKEYQRITNCNDPESIERINESINLLRSSSIQYQFRTTALPHLHTEEFLFNLRNSFINDSYIVQKFREGMTIDSFN
jgi:pyruvate formate lyase activating enzyme